MVRHKQGFTLIELLAVIAVLGLILTIAIPNALKIIEKACMETFRESARGIIKAVQINYVDRFMDSGDIKDVTFTYQDGIEYSSIPGVKLDYQWAKPKSGTIKVNSEGGIGLAIYNGVYCAKKEFYSSEITVSKTSE